MIIRLAEKKDITAVCQLMTELANHEKFEGFNVSEQYFEENFLGANQYAELYVIDADGEIVGMGNVVKLASTLLGGHELYLRDFIVTESHRENGYGGKFVAFLSQLAKEKGCQKIRWTVSKWNEEVLSMYSKISTIEHDVAASITDVEQMG